MTLLARPESLSVATTVTWKTLSPFLSPGSSKLVPAFSFRVMLPPEFTAGLKNSASFPPSRQVMVPPEEGVALNCPTVPSASSGRLTLSGPVMVGPDAVGVALTASEYSPQ